MAAPCPDGAAAQRLSGLAEAKVLIDALTFVAAATPKLIEDLCQQIEALQREAKMRGVAAAPAPCADSEGQRPEGCEHGGAVFRAMPAPSECSEYCSSDPGGIEAMYERSFEAFGSEGKSLPDCETSLRLCQAPATGALAPTLTRDAAGPASTDAAGQDLVNGEAPRHQAGATPLDPEAEDWQAIPQHLRWLAAFGADGLRCAVGEKAPEMIHSQVRVAPGADLVEGLRERPSATASPTWSAVDPASLVASSRNVVFAKQTVRSAGAASTEWSVLVLDMPGDFLLELELLEDASPINWVSLGLVPASTPAGTIAREHCYYYWGYFVSTWWLCSPAGITSGIRGSRRRDLQLAPGTLPTVLKKGQPLTLTRLGGALTLAVGEGQAVALPSAEALEAGEPMLPCVLLGIQCAARLRRLCTRVSSGQRGGSDALARGAGKAAEPLPRRQLSGG